MTRVEWASSSKQSDLDQHLCLDLCATVAPQVGSGIGAE
jgi:hypothetical protein